VLGPAERLGRKAVLFLAGDAIVLGNILARDAEQPRTASQSERQLDDGGKGNSRKGTGGTDPIGMRTSEASLLLRTSSDIFSGKTPAP
jgi:hypothetical protein